MHSQVFALTVCFEVPNTAYTGASRLTSSVAAIQSPDQRCCATIPRRTNFPKDYRP